MRMHKHCILTKGMKQQLLILFAKIKMCIIDKKFEKTEHFETSRVKWANNRFKSNDYLNKIKQFCWKSQIKNL